MVIVKWGLGLLLFMKDMLCFVILMLIGMGRTCAYVHHVDKDAF